MKPTKQSLAKAHLQLQKIVEEFESGELDLESSIPKFKQGVELAKAIKSKLNDLEVEIEEIKAQFQDTNPK
jgi:exodeoxyribonuclease VII small subunit